MQRNVLYADPDPDARERFETAAAAMDMDLTVTTVGTVEASLSAIDNTEFDVVVAEVAFDGTDGSPIFSHAREAGVPAIAFTTRPFEDVADAGLIDALSAYLSKEAEDEPFEALVAEIASLLRDRSELAYPTPDDEEERLAAVDRYDLEELREVASFDRLTRIAQGYFDTRFAFIGLITEDSEEFLSYQGDDMERLERSCTICTFGIMEEGVMQVDDTETDPRFRYVDALHDAGIKWYAGMPLVNEDGHRVGMFCIADSDQHDLSEADVNVLQLFAAEAMDRIETHQRAAGEGG